MHKIIFIQKQVNITRFGYIFVLAMFLASCVKNDTYLEPDRYIAYVDPQPDSRLPYNQQSYSLLLFRDSITTANMAFPVRFFTAIDKDVQLTARIDPSLLSVYDRIANAGIPSPSLPDGAFSLSNAEVTIKAGSLVSADSIRLILADAARLDLTDSSKTYIVPVRLTATSALLPASDTIRQTMFFQISLTHIRSSILDPYSMRNLELIKQSDGSLIPQNGFIQSEIGFPASINIDIGSVLPISIIPDLSLVPGFNTANNTSYLPLPSAAYTIENNATSISAGNTQTDNIYYIGFTSAFMPQPGESYLLPLKIKDEGAVPPSQYSTTFIVTSVAPEIIYARNNWQIVTVSSEDMTYGSIAMNALDGNYFSDWFSSYDSGPVSAPQWLIVDMGRVNTMHGILFRRSLSAGPEYQPKQVRIYASMDNISWDAGQDIEIPESTSSNQNFFISLPASVAARYIRFEIESSQSDPFMGVAVAEFGVY